MLSSTESKRKLVHVSSVIFALLIGRIPAWAISGACLFAFLFNLLLLPKLTAKGLERDNDLKRGFPLGILAYPSVLLVLSLVFYRNQIFLALAWGMMAFGDGFAGLVGSSSFNMSYFNKKAWEWNSGKTIAGTLAFVLFGAFFTFLLIYFLPVDTRMGLPLLAWVVATIIAACVSAWVETLRGLIDDNISVPVTASLTAALVIKFYALGPLPQPQDFLPWIIAAGFLSLVTVLLKKMTITGALCGLLIAFFLILGTGRLGFSLLASFFVLGTLASQWAKKWKQSRGLAQEQGGIRGIRHAIANGGVAAIGGILAYLEPSQVMLCAIAGSFAAATSDTLSSEIGNRYGKKFYDILSFQPAKRGNDGVISLPGSLAGILGSFLISIIFLIQVPGLKSAGIVFAAGLVGNLVDSILGATLQRRGYMTNDTVNFSMALAGFATAIALTKLLQ